MLACCSFIKKHFVIQSNWRNSIAPKKKFTVNCQDAVLELFARMRSANAPVPGADIIYKIGLKALLTNDGLYLRPMVNRMVV
jgi:hypothetical protein